MPGLLAGGATAYAAALEFGPVTEAVDGSQYAQVFYVAVRDGAAQAGSGVRGNPWASLDHALELIRDAGPERRYAVLVAQGTYPCLALPMKEYVDLYGGFEAAGWKRDVGAYPTILDGGQSARVMLGANQARLDGFTLLHGMSREAGGAILCNQTSPWLSNNIFTVNAALTPHVASNDGPAQGGAVACLGGARPRIERNIFAFNSTDAGQGGALVCREQSSPRVEGNVFLGNATGIGRPEDSASNSGGAIACLDDSSPLIRNNMFSNNLAGAGGEGGAIYARAATPVVQSNIIVGNSCDGRGGAILLTAMSEARIWDNLIELNSAANSGGGVCLAESSRSSLVNNMIVGNTAALGGGLGSLNSHLALMNNTLCDNTADQGGAVYVQGGPHGTHKDPSIINTIVFGNAGLPQILLRPNTLPLDLNYNCLGDVGNGDSNLVADPGLTDDGLTGKVATMTFEPNRIQTRMVVILSGPARVGDLKGRVIRVGSKRSVIAANAGQELADHQELVVWGDMTGGGMNVPPIGLAIFPTYRLAAGSVLIGAGTPQGAPELDINGELRWSAGTLTPRVDIGAAEYSPRFDSAQSLRVSQEVGILKLLAPPEARPQTGGTAQPEAREQGLSEAGRVTQLEAAPPTPTPQSTPNSQSRQIKPTAPMPRDL